MAPSQNDDAEAGGTPIGPAERVGDSPPRRASALAASAALLVAAWVVLVIQVLLDAHAHVAAMEIVSARAGAHAAVAVVVLLGAALVIDAATRRTVDRVWLALLTIGVALAAVLVLRRSVGTMNAPAVGPWLVEVAAAVGLTWCAAVRIRPAASDPAQRLVAARTWLVTALAALGGRSVLAATTPAIIPTAGELQILAAGVVITAGLLTWLLRRSVAPLWRGAACAALALGGGVGILADPPDRLVAVLAAGMAAVLIGPPRLHIARRAGAAARTVSTASSATTQRIGEYGDQVQDRVALVRPRIARVLHAARRASGSAARLLAPAGTDGAAPTGTRATRRDWGWFGLMALVLGAVVAHRVYWAWEAGWQLAGDSAKVAARGYDVGSRNTPLLGMPTALGDNGGHHLGPANLDLLTPWTRLLGFRMAAFVGAAFWVFTMSLAAIATAFRAGGRAAAVLIWLAIAAHCTLVTRGNLFDAVVVPSIMCILLTLTASWAATTGTPRALPWALGAASLASQTYLPHAPVTVFPALWAAWVVWRQYRLDRTDRAAKQGLQWSVAVLALLWAQPIWSDVVHHGQNMRALWDSLFVVTAQVGASGIWRTIAWVFRVPPPFERFDLAKSTDFHDYLSGLGITGFIVAAALVAAWRATKAVATTSERRLRVLTVVAVVAGAATTSQIPADDVRWYFLLWLAVLSIWCWFVIGMTAVLAVRRRWHLSPVQARLARPVTLVAGAAVFVAYAVVAIENLDRVAEQRSFLDRAAATVPGPAVAATDGSGEVLVIRLGTAQDELVDTLLGELITHDRGVRVEPSIRGYYGDRRVADAGWSGPVLAVVDGAAPLRSPGARVLSRVVPADWSQTEFDAAAERVASWAAAHGPIELTPSGVAALPSFADGWTGLLTCDDLTAAAPDRPGPLAPGALLRLYAAGMVASPTLPPDLQDDVSAASGPSPVEVWWYPEVAFDQPPSSLRLLRSGDVCPPALTPADAPPGS